MFVVTGVAGALAGTVVFSGTVFVAGFTTLDGLETAGGCGELVDVVAGLTAFITLPVATAVTGAGGLTLVGVLFDAVTATVAVFAAVTGLGAVAEVATGAIAFTGAPVVTETVGALAGRDVTVGAVFETTALTLVALATTPGFGAVVGMTGEGAVT